MSPAEVSSGLNLTNLKERKSRLDLNLRIASSVVLVPGDWQIFGASALTGTGLFEGVSLIRNN